MRKYKCGNSSCLNHCKTELNVFQKEPNKCLLNGKDQTWERIDEPLLGKAAGAKPEPMQKLTAEVFKHPDCPEWAQWAAVTSDGDAEWFEQEPYAVSEYDSYDGSISGYWTAKGKDKDIPGRYDYGNWINSLIKNPDFKMTVRFKKLHPDAKAPYQATPGSAGFDLTAVHREGAGYHQIRYCTGIAVEIPAGYVGLVFPRSSVYKTKQTLANCVGVIDSDYRGEITAIFDFHRESEFYDIGDRIAQLVIMPIPAVRFVEAEELTETERGTGGYGSTGK